MRQELCSDNERLGPYLASIPEHIAQHGFEVSGKLARETEDTMAEIARLDAHLGSRADLRAMLPFIEGAASSRMERVVASAEEVAAAMIGRSRSRDASLTAAGIRSSVGLSAAADGEHLDESAVLAAHEALLGGDPDGRRLVGGWRSQQVWIGGWRPQTAAFVPPVHARVPSLMADLLECLPRRDVSPIVLAAVMHAQFETIHPFPDGNGRVGRALFSAVLRDQGVTEDLSVPVSFGLEPLHRAYIDGLIAYREGDIAPIVSTFLEALHLGMSRTRALASNMTAVQGEWRAEVGGRRGSAAVNALDVLPELPVLTVASLAARLGVSDVAAGRAIARLEEVGALERLGKGARNRQWRVPAVVAELDRQARGPHRF